MNKRVAGVVAAAALLGPAAGAHAQGNVVIRGIIRVARVAQPGSGQLDEAKVGDQIRPGGRVRTAGRSAVGLRFPDQSVLRLGELTEVQVNNPSRRDTRLLRGQILASYNAPGTITGGYAVCAVRGTDIHFVENPDTKTAEVRCYGGRAFVGTSSNPMSAGLATNITPTSLTDAGLAGSSEDFTGGEVRFTDGPYQGQVRNITQFNAQTGTVTFQPALGTGRAAGTDGTNGYLLAKRRGDPIVELRQNEGTVVSLGRVSAPRKVPSEKYGFLQKQPFYQALEEGQNTAVYAGTDDHQTQQDQDTGLRESTDIVTHGPGGPVCLFGEGPVFGRRALRSLLATQIRRDDVSGSTPEQRVIPSNVMTPTQAGITDKIALKLEPFGVLSDETSVVGSRVRMVGSSGNMYGELGYRYLRLHGDENRHDISEAFVQFRGKHGELTGGRQHLFLRLANNTNVGTLLGLDTTDAIVYKLPFKGRFKQTIGYVFDTGPLESGDFSGNIGGSFKTFFARGQMQVRKGNVGYGVMLPTDSGRKVGWSVDASQPIIPNKLDIYGEIGDDTKDHNLYVAGLYIPALYHSAKVDAFIEYHNRKGVNERWTFRVRRQLYKGLLIVGFIDRSSGSDSDLHGGGALLYSYQFK